MVRDLLGDLARERGVECGVGAHVQAEQVLGGIERVRGDQFGVRPSRIADVVGVVVFQDETARRLGHDDVVAPADVRGERLHVAFGHLAEAGDVAAVQQGRAATARPAQLTSDAVALVDLDQVTADRWFLILHRAGCEQRHRALRFGQGHRWAVREPRGEPLPGERWQQPDRGHAGGGLRDLADERAGLGADDPVGEGRHACGEFADAVGATHDPRRRPGPGRLDAGVELHRIGPQHQAREVDVALVERRRVGAVDDAALAVEALVDHLVLIGRRHASGIVVGVAIDHLEQRRERRAQRDALLAPVTDLEHAAELGAHRGLVDVDRFGGVVDARHAAGLDVTVLQPVGTRLARVRLVIEGPIGVRRNIASMPRARTRAHPFERSHMLDELGRHPLDGGDPFDVLVVGGGITGVGVALDAAHRGLRVALVERDDFASGTSSKSSKLIHGGLRYLQNGDVRLVYDALHERRRLMRNAPHLVEVLPFLIPIMTKDGVISRKIAKALGSALWMYDVTGGWRIGKLHRRLSADAAAAHFPSTHLDRLSGGFLYFDAATDDARLTLTIARTAAEHGAVVVNRCRLVEIVHRDGRVAGAVVDADGASIEVAARSIVNACGVWADDVRALDEGVHPGSIRPAKGVHITLPWHLVGNDIAVIIPVRGDKRSLFLIPWGPLGDGTFRHVYVGTTDTDDHGSLDEPVADGDDIDYLLTALNHSLDLSSRAPITRDDITGTWAGLRPLVNSDRPTSRAPRKTCHAATRSP